ncbi:Uncharacterised protein [Yersinia frederiksenii]|uniref:hypothetical protein n=1 Tax=Yersinia frederiksenii TaxID=29484 RepID=UPI0005DC42FE|nr:hypothetical protein [Yersinia frederiksenii]CND07500.1 Uncharacterised protein [Yersinia frederiksenii]
MSENTDYVELEKKYLDVVAENAALKTAIEFSTAPDMWEEHGELLEYKYVDWYVDELNNATSNTPATDAALNEIKAQGIDAFADDLGESVKSLSTTSPQYKAAKSIVFRAVKFAASLRGGE